ncbi:phosphoenolpyruvate synthase [Anaeramoeba ignava]|uniref:pyruvate, water dikinase n=1 Tax=Anaeramoeba ignava TaxID=1746090 RepID=A0A9Q0RCF2_ANAIG|nr:phosphoenolpyruvate synthase [Anaeramoeba ignava]
MGNTKTKIETHINKISNIHIWNQISKQPESSFYSQTQVVKLIIDLKDNDSIYFLQTNKYFYHFFFCQDFLSFPKRNLVVPDNRIFNRNNYNNGPERRFILGTLCYYLDKKLWVFELMAGDPLEGELFVKSFNIIKKNVFFGSELKYHPKSFLHQNIIKTDEIIQKSDIKIITSNEIYGSMEYQSLTLGTTYGILKILEKVEQNEEIEQSITPEHILVTGEIPVDIPPVAGLITSTFQAPLSHVALLSANRNTPNMALKNAIDKDFIQSLNGKFVKLVVTRQEFQVIEFPDGKQSKEYLDWEQKMERKKSRIPKIEVLFSDENIGLIQLQNLQEIHLAMVGHKAYTLNGLKAINLPKKIDVPGFVIPFYFYLQFSQQFDIENSILKSQEFEQSPENRRKMLKELQEKIKKSHIDSQLIESIKEKISEIEKEFEETIKNHFDGFIFRSSTNVEDLPGFTGNGLFESLPIKSISDEEIEKTMLEIYSSLWSFKTIEELKLFQIDLSKISMAIIVQPFLSKNMKANGVALTGNPYKPAYPSFFVNIQSSKGSVTDSKSNVNPEQIFIFENSRKNETENKDEKVICQEVVSTSSLVDSPILNSNDISNLNSLLKAINWKFGGLYYKHGCNSAEVEFLVPNDEDFIFVVQSRPFQIEMNENLN